MTAGVRTQSSLNLYLVFPTMGSPRVLKDCKHHWIKNNMMIILICFVWGVKDCFTFNVCPSSSSYVNGQKFTGGGGCRSFNSPGISDNIVTLCAEEQLCHAAELSGGKTKANKGATASVHHQLPVNDHFNRTLPQFPLSSTYPSGIQNHPPAHPHFSY